jgi:hypothetical protein
MPVVERIEKILATAFGPAECDARLWPDSPDMPCLYSCWLLESRENWIFPQQLVRATESMAGPTHGEYSDIQLSDDLLASYAKHIARHRKSPFYDQAVLLLQVPTGNRRWPLDIPRAESFTDRPFGAP